MSKHTPGPWDASDDGDIWTAGPGIPLLRADRQYRTWGRELSEAERQANARLAAAAPDLLAALEAIADSCERGATSFDAMNLARAALAALTHPSHGSTLEGEER